MRQARSSSEKSDNYDNKKNHIRCMLEFVMLKFIPLVPQRYLALLKGINF